MLPHLAWEYIDKNYTKALFYIICNIWLNRMFKTVIHMTQHKLNKITWKQPAVEIPWYIDSNTKVKWCWKIDYYIPPMVW